MTKHLYILDDDLWASLDRDAVAKTAAQMKEAGLWKLPYDDGPVWLRAHTLTFQDWFYGGKEVMQPDLAAEVRIDGLATPADDHSYVVRKITFAQREKERARIRTVLANPPMADWTPQERRTEAENIRYFIPKEGIRKSFTYSNWLISYDGIPPIKGPPGTEEALSKMVRAGRGDAMRTFFGDAKFKESNPEHVAATELESARIKAFLADILVVVLACKGTKRDERVRGPMQAGPLPTADREIVTRVSLDVGPRVDHGGTHNSPIAHMRAGHLHTFRTGPGREQSIQKWIDPIFVNANAEFKATRRAYEVGADEG